MAFAKLQTAHLSRLLVLGLIGVLFTACGQKDDTEAIRSLIQQGAGLAQKHAVGDIMALTTPDFTASPGRRYAGEVKRILFLAFRHYRRFKIHYPQPSVEISQKADSARAALYFIIVRQDRPFPQLKELYQDPQRWIEAARSKADQYQLKLNLVKTGDQWKVHKAHLEGFKGFGF